MECSVVSFDRIYPNALCQSAVQMLLALTAEHFRLRYEIRSASSRGCPACQWLAQNIPLVVQHGELADPLAQMQVREVKETHGDTAFRWAERGGSFRFDISFCRKVCYTCFAAYPAHFTGREVSAMPDITTFILSVAANVISYYICKWLDGWLKGRKH